MGQKYAYIIPMGEHNSDPDDLEFWARRGELYHAYLVDGNIEYDGEHLSTYKEAKQWLKDTAAEMGWDWRDIEFSVDE